MSAKPEPDKPPPSVPDILARALVAASPKFAGSLAILYDGFRARWSARVSQVSDEVTAVMPPEKLSRRLEAQPALDAAFAAALEAAGRTGLEAKRRLLGRVIARAVLDDARVDEATLLVGVLSQIDAPHVRCLEAIHRAEEEAEAAGEIAPRAQYAERETVPRIAEVGRAHPDPVLAALASLGLIETSNTWGDTAILKGLTPFGQALLRDLRAASDPSAGDNDSR